MAAIEKPPPPGADTQILDLEDLVPDRPRVKFPGGKVYELVHINELGIVELKQIQKRWEQVGDLLSKGEGDDISESEAQVLADAIDALTLTLVPKASAEEVSALTDTQKTRIIYHFFGSVPKAEGADADDSPLPTTAS